MSLESNLPLNLRLRREELGEALVWHLEGGGVSVYKGKTLKGVSGYLQRHYLGDLSKEKKTYYSRLIMLQLENGESLEWVRHQLDNYLSGLPNDKEKEESNTFDLSTSIQEPSPILKEIIDAGKVVYGEMGWGWGESAYREALSLELEARGYRCSQEVSVPILYRGRELSHVNSRIDILVRYEGGQWIGQGIIIELKSDSASRLSMERAWCQCQRYLRITGHNMGIVINFPDKETDEIEYRYQ